MKNGSSNVASSKTAPTAAEEDRFSSSSVSCSVIIPVRNGGAKFRDCLKAVAAAIRPQDEIIVIADGEGDGSWRIAEEMNVRLINLPTVSGPGQARNAGADAARSQILFFVDADVMIPPQAVQRVCTAFDQEKDLAALIGSYDGDPGEANFHSQFKNLFHHFVHQNGLAEASTFWGACGAIRREVFVALGGFSSTYKRPSIEDIELGYRLKAGSHRIRLLPDLQVKHLKRWNAQSLIGTDVFDRAAPWTELIWNYLVRRKKVSSDLNIGLRYRLSLITSFLLVAAMAGALFTLWTLPLIVLLGVFFIALQAPFFNFFKTKRGFQFACRALAWRFGYDIYSGLGFCYGSLRFANASTRKVLSQAFAKLDAVALGTGVGAAWGGAICAMTAVLLIKNGYPMGPNLALLGQYFPAYSVTWTGTLIGLLYGFASGFVFGFSFACARNAAMRIHLGSRKVQRFLYRVREL